MKIGIITFHRAINYGAILQTYAMYNYLKNNYDNVYVVDYFPEYLHKRYAVFCLKRDLSKNIIRMCQNILDEIFCINQRYHRKKLFASFIKKNLQLNSINSKYDIIFLGSDQIWNPVLTGNILDPIFWGNNINANKICSYAPSMETEIEYTDKTKQQIRNYLENFSSLSVREKSLKDYLKNKFNKDSTLVCDPVFLLDQCFWIQKCVSKPPINKEYVLLYLVRVSNKIIKKVRTFCKIKGLELIIISNDSHYYIHKNIILSPDEFVNYIYHATYIFSTSFHATAFSIILKKQFYTFSLGNKGNSRVIDLLNNIGISKRLITINDDIIDDNFISYDQHVDKINTLIKTSKDYIEKCCYL